MWIYQQKQKTCLMILCEEVPILLHQQMILPDHGGIYKAI
jgi:hypothetical protein